MIDQVDNVTGDLQSGHSYNIDPNIVRQSEDIATQPGIKSNGAGLAATLHAAKIFSSADSVSAPRAYPYYPRFYARADSRFNSKLLAELTSYSQLVNSDIIGIDAQSDPVENRIRVFLTLSYDKSVLRLPLSLASDGTVKWLALVAAVLTNRSVVAVEEPENFLHPFMQREIVNIIRASCKNASEPTFAIITTHSETLINSVSPEELVVLSMKDGATSAIRPINVEELRAEIEKTGFGLGWYFLSGAIE